MKFHELVQKDIIPTKSEVYGEPSTTMKVDPTVKMMENIFPVLQDLYHPNLNKSKYLI